MPPPKARAGARVAVVSPSWAGPGVYPDVHELAMRRLRDEIGVEPVEFPATRRPDATPAERAALFTAGEREITPVAEFSEEDNPWGTPTALTTSPPMVPGPGWTWHRPGRVVTAPTWGGNLEILSWGQ